MSRIRVAVASWTWRLGANSRVGMAYYEDDPTNVRLCDHRHRSALRAEDCARHIAQMWALDEGPDR